MSLQTRSLDTVSPGVKTVKKPFRKPLVLFVTVCDCEATASNAISVLCCNCP